MNRSKNQIIGLLLMSILVLLAQGCATVTKGRDQAVTVTTDPAGARCTLTREGAILAVIQPTPGSISIQKSKKDVSVHCELAEYKDTAGVFESKFADMTMGNILLGGVIGAAIDASSGASHEYDPIVTLTMIPARFASVEDRDTFFNKMRDDFIQGSDESMKLIAEKCKPQMCDYEKEEAEKARVSRLAEIEREREIALIGDSMIAIESKQAGKDKQSGSETTASLSGTAEQSVGVTNSPLIGDWKGDVAAYPSLGMPMVLHIEKQDSQNLTGHATISGHYLGCKDSDVTLTPTSGNKFTIVLSGLGCRGKGTLEHQGVALKGKVKFEDYHQAKPVDLIKSGY